MSVTVLKRVLDMSPNAGEYTPVVLDGQRTARVACPQCGYTALLDHEIAADGTVTPSVICPRGDDKQCTWHANVRLAGWLS